MIVGAAESTPLVRKLPTLRIRRSSGQQRRQCRRRRRLAGEVPCSEPVLQVTSASGGASARQVTGMIKIYARGRARGAARAKRCLSVGCG